MDISYCMASGYMFTSTTRVRPAPASCFQVQSLYSHFTPAVPSAKQHNCELALQQTQ